MKTREPGHVAVLVEGLTPIDELEAVHRASALAWLGSTDDIYRRIPPKTPSTHLVAYFLRHDPVDRSVLLVDHRKARLWLPTGGHVDVGEDPMETVRREAREELGLTAVFADPRARPLFVTVTETETNGDRTSRHTDVSPWYLLSGSCRDPIHPDEREFFAARWWTRSEVAAADPVSMEPHLMRFLTKVDAAN